MHPKTIYYLFMALFAIAFSATSTSYGPFMNSIGMSFTEMEIVNTAFIIAMLVAEIPTGMWADGRGRRWSLTMGTSFAGVGFFLYGFAMNFWMVLVAEVTVGIGFAFISGAGQAWVTDALKERGEDMNVRSVLGHASSFQGVARILAGVLGAIVAGHIGLRFPWFLSALSMLLLVAFVRFAMKPGVGESSEPMSEKEALKKSLVFLRGDRALIWIILMTVVAGLAGTINHFWHPYFLVHLTQSQLGIVWVMVSVGHIIGGQVIARTKHRPGQEITYSILSNLVMGITIVALAKTASLHMALSLIVLHNVGRGGINPVVDAYVQHRIGSGNRATFGSLLSMFRHGGSGIAFALNGILAIGLSYGEPTVRHVWMSMGILMIVSTLFIALFRPKNGKA